MDRVERIIYPVWRELRLRWKHPPTLSEYCDGVCFIYLSINGTAIFIEDSEDENAAWLDVVGHGMYLSRAQSHMLENIMRGLGFDKIKAGYTDRRVADYLEHLGFTEIDNQMVLDLCPSNLHS